MKIEFQENGKIQRTVVIPKIFIKIYSTVVFKRDLSLKLVCFDEDFFTLYSDLAFCNTVTHQCTSHRYIFFQFYVITIQLPKVRYSSLTANYIVKIVTDD